VPVPVGIDPDLGRYLQSLEDRLETLENPQGPTPVFTCTTANMPAAASYVNMVLRNSTLNILAVSDGTSWIRQDTGAAI